MNGMRRSRAPRLCGSPRMRLTLMWFLPGSMPARWPHPVRMGWTRDSSSRTRPFVWRRKQVAHRLPSGATRGASTRLCSWVASMKPRSRWLSRHNMRMSCASRLLSGELFRSDPGWRYCEGGSTRLESWPKRPDSLDAQAIMPRRSSRISLMSWEEPCTSVVWRRDSN